jgi:hypothetical protein
MGRVKNIVQTTPLLYSYHTKIKIQLGEVPILMKERYKIVDGIYYDLLQQKYGEKTGSIGGQAGAAGTWTLDTICWG